MPSPNRRILAVGLLFAVVLCAAFPLPAEAPRISLDVVSLGVGAAFSAANARVGIQVPFEGPWSYAVEAQAYLALPSDTLLVQGAAVAVIRYRPWSALGLYLGAGPGLGAYEARALASAGGPAASEQVGVKLYLVAETGWTFQFENFPVFFEPFVRGFGAAGWDGRSGSAVAALDAWSAFAGVDVGLRAGWRL